MQQGQTPVLILNPNTERESGQDARKKNIEVAVEVSNVLRSTFGPKSSLKILLDPTGGIVLTNDGYAILREIDVQSPAARSIVDISRAQDEEVGDGSTTVILLAGEILKRHLEIIDSGLHPRLIVNSLYSILEEIITYSENIATSIDINNRESLKRVLSSVVGTRLISKFSDRMSDLCIDAIQIVCETSSFGRKIDFKRHLRIEKIPGGLIEDCRLVKGVILNKDVLHSNMRRDISNPRILLLEMPLEYKKMDSGGNIDIGIENSFSKFLEQEENYIKSVVLQINSLNPDLVICEKGINDLAIHFLMKYGISALRRCRKSDMIRLQRATGATIISDISRATTEDIGTYCKKFEVRKIGDEYFSFIEESSNPKSCTILLRGSSKELLNEFERNLHDSLATVKNLYLLPKIVGGGGSFELNVSEYLREKSSEFSDHNRQIFEAVADSFDELVRLLIKNSGKEPFSVLTEFQNMIRSGKRDVCYDAISRSICNAFESQIIDPLLVKSQAIKSAIESCCLLIRVDDVISGLSKKDR